MSRYRACCRRECPGFCCDMMSREPQRMLPHLSDVYCKKISEWRRSFREQGHGHCGADWIPLLTPSFFSHIHTFLRLCMSHRTHFFCLNVSLMAKEGRGKLRRAKHHMQTKSCFSDTAWLIMIQRGGSLSSLSRVFWVRHWAHQPFLENLLSSQMQQQTLCHVVGIIAVSAPVTSKSKANISMSSLLDSIISRELILEPRMLAGV